MREKLERLAREREADHAKKAAAKRLLDAAVKNSPSYQRVTQTTSDRFARCETLLSDIRWHQKRSVFSGSAKAARGVRVFAKAGQTEIDIFGEIDQTMTGAVRQALKEADGQPVVVKIDSGGGDALAGFSIYDELKSYRGSVTAIIANAMSAGSVIAMGAKKILMRPSAFLMMHHATIENGSDKQNETDFLAKIDARMRTIYSTRLSSKKVLELMRSESFLNADECLKLGIVDQVI